MGTSRKPLFVLPDLSAGGAEQSTLWLIEHLRARGIDPTLFLLRRRGAFLDRLDPSAKVVWALEDDASIHRNAAVVMRKLLASVRESDLVVGALELESTYFAWMCGRLLRRPVIGWVHAVMNEHLKELNAVHTHITRLVYPRLDRIVVPSQGAADSLARVAALDPERITVIPSSVDVPLLESRAAEPLPAWAVPVFGKPTLLGVGRLVPSKGFDVLLHAHARVRRDGLDHHLVIVGEGPMRGELERLTDRLGVRSSVHLPGFSPNPWALMKAADAFILPSWFEGLSLVVLEALGIGTPVVATDCPGGPSDLLDHGRYGWLVPPGDVESLALAVARLLRDPSARDAMRSAGPARAREFGPERVLPLWERVLGSVG